MPGGTGLGSAPLDRSRRGIRGLSAVCCNHSTRTMSGPDARTPVYVVRELDGARVQTRKVMNIYVGNLPYTITKDELMDLFVGFGEVSSVNLITDKATGELRGFGFVEMPTQSEAEAAIKGLNGTAIAGRAIQVKIARDRRR